jgi:PAS domain S-box-containing protein
MQRTRFWVAIGCFALTGLFAGVLWVYASRLAEADIRIHQILDNTPNSLIICNKKNSVVYMNPQATRLTGYTLADLQSGGLELIVPDEWADAHREGIDSVAGKYDRNHYQTPHRHLSKIMAVKCRDGKLVRASITVVSIVMADGLEFFAWITPLPKEDLTGDLPPRKFK